MRLTAIKLAGFKSFVDPTTLTINANLTGIVGPNGCGKSNVIDAVRWVTGESSAKQLRGEQLEDVIFNGSKGRKPIGRVSVELQFDNSAGKLGGQYARFSEIAVSRMLTRDGGSRYYINGSKARRRDVVDLFLGTGLGGRSNYAVIEQGAVNRLVEAKPDQLRQVLEEAAGISRYKERRRETENRIRHTRENLDRLNDLIGEVTQRLSVLKRQARNAERYKVLKQDERRLRAELLALRWRAFDEDVQTAREKLQQREQALAEAVSGQRHAHDVRDAHTRAQQAATDACQQHQTTFYDAQAEATRLAQALEHARRLREMQQRERDELASRKTQLETRESTDQATLEQAEREIAKAESELAVHQGRREDARARLVESDRANEEAEKQWDAHNSNERSPVAQLEAERTQRGYLVKRINETDAALGRRRDESDKLAHDDDEVSLHTLAEQVQALADQVTHDETQHQQTAENLAVLDAEIIQLVSRLDDSRTRLAEQEARLASEKTMQQAVLREDDASVRDWLKLQGFENACSVARLVEAPAQWQAAVEVVLGDWLAGFSVDALPEQEQPWPGNSLTLVEAGDEDMVDKTPTLSRLPCLASRITAPAAVMAAASRVFVADSVDSALAVRHQLAPEQIIVSLDGACVGRAKLRTPASGAGTQGVLEREKNIKSLTAESRKTAAQFQAFGDEQAELEQRRQALREQHQAQQQHLATAHRDLAHKRAEYQGSQVRLEQHRQRAAELAEDQSRLQQQQAADQNELTALDARVAALSRQAEQYTQDRDAAQRVLATARSQRNEVRQRFDEAESCVRRVEQDTAAARSRRDSLAARLEDTRTTKAQVAKRLAACDVPAGDGSGNGVPSQADHDGAKERRQKAETVLHQSRDALRAAEKKGEEAARAVMQADNAVEHAREAMQQARIVVETASARCEGLVEQLDEIGEDAAAVLKNIDAQATVDAWHVEIEAAERKIARLGAINLAAIEEYDVEAERENYLNEQHADLSEALDTLENAIAKIDRETRSRFKDMFTQVNQRFGVMFPTLFGGGQASLELTEDDLLSTGVRVMARPPGKRNATIQMLSGGEKAMTAVALLFALFELNPAPFCMLDEIDAPLDDANVSRFCDLVREMSANVQFIVITHNKLTMELVEQLHGVTMLEPGVSRLVSVNIDEALDMAG